MSKKVFSWGNQMIAPAVIGFYFIKTN